MIVGVMMVVIMNNEVMVICFSLALSLHCLTLRTTSILLNVETGDRSPERWGRAPLRRLSKKD